MKRLDFEVTNKMNRPDRGGRREGRDVCNALLDFIDLARIDRERRDRFHQIAIATSPPNFHADAAIVIRLTQSSDNAVDACRQIVRQRFS